MCSLSLTMYSRLQQTGINLSGRNYPKTIQLLCLLVVAIAIAITISIVTWMQYEAQKQIQKEIKRIAGLKIFHTWTKTYVHTTSAVCLFSSTSITLSNAQLFHSLLIWRFTLPTSSGIATRWLRVVSNLAELKCLPVGCAHPVQMSWGLGSNQSNVVCHRKKQIRCNSQMAKRTSIAFSLPPLKGCIFVLGMYVHRYFCAYVSEWVSERSVRVVYNNRKSLRSL